MVRLSLGSQILLVIPLILLMMDRASSDSPENQIEVKRNKGVESCVVLVGFLFHHEIPEDAFSGDVVEYQVSEACDESLPPWLEYDPSTKTFTGFTQAAEVETKTFICVKAIGRSPAPGVPPSVAKDVFSVDVDVGLTPAFACPESDTVVLATVYVDLTLSELSKAEILKVLSSVGTALNIPPEDVRFTRFNRRYRPETHPVLFSGKGDSEEQSKGSRVQFQVGCSSDVITEDHPLVQFLKQKAPTGELSRIIGYPVMDWTVHKGFRPGNAPRE